MTTCYDDIEAVTRLLQEKEKVKFVIIDKDKISLKISSICDNNNFHFVT